jgi:Aldo/keto reductase family
MSLRRWPNKYCSLLLFLATLATILYHCYNFQISDRLTLTQPMMRTISVAAPHVISSGKPFIVYGTAWKKDGTALYVQQAVKAGFRFIDTACQPKHYNEKGVGDGWKAAAAELGLKRDDLFLQTKYTPYPGQDPNRVPYDPSSSLEAQVQQSLSVSLSNLQVWPTSNTTSVLENSPRVCHLLLPRLLFLPLLFAYLLLSSR